MALLFCQLKTARHESDPDSELDSELEDGELSLVLLSPELDGSTSALALKAGSTARWGAPSAEPLAPPVELTEVPAAPCRLAKSTQVLGSSQCTT